MISRDKTDEREETRGRVQYAAAQDRNSALSRASWRILLADPKGERVFRDLVASTEAIARRAFRAAGPGPAATRGEDAALPPSAGRRNRCILAGKARKWSARKQSRRGYRVLDRSSIGKGEHFLSADGYLMPTKKNQPPPDLRCFKQSRK
jgi:hypothetical protein